MTGDLAAPPAHLRAGSADIRCNATTPGPCGPWTCTAAAGHEPLDHAAYSPFNYDEPAHTWPAAPLQARQGQEICRAIQPMPGGAHGAVCNAAPGHGAPFHAAYSAFGKLIRTWPAEAAPGATAAETAPRQPHGSRTKIDPARKHAASIRDSLPAADARIALARWQEAAGAFADVGPNAPDKVWRQAQRAERAAAAAAASKLGALLAEIDARAGAR